MALSLIVPSPAFSFPLIKLLNLIFKNQINAFFILKSKLLPFFTSSTLKINLQNPIHCSPSKIGHGPRGHNLRQYCICISLSLHHPLFCFFTFLSILFFFPSLVSFPFYSLFLWFILFPSSFFQPPFPFVYFFF